MEANRHGRYHLRQPPEKQINFPPLPFPPSIRRDGQHSWNDVRVYWCWCEAVSQISEGRGIDSGDDEEILMHIYQLIKGQWQQASPPSFPFTSPWNPVSTPTSTPSSPTPFVSELSSYLQRGGVPAHSSAVWPWRCSSEAVEELITLFIGFKRLVYLLLPEFPGEVFGSLYCIITLSLV